MNAIEQFLTSNGDTVLAVIIGGAIVLLGQLLVARSTKLAADRNASATLSVAEIERDTARLELTLKQDELVFDQRLRTSAKFLEKLEQWDESARDESKLGYDPSKVAPQFFDGRSGSERWAAKKVLHEMHIIFPPKVTESAAAAVEAGLSLLNAHETNFYTSREDDKERRHATEQDRISALLRFESAREGFLKALQTLMHPN